MIVYRAWINQPSTLQPLHEHHGRRCIVVEGAYGITAYFTHGKVYSLQVLPEFITKSKRPHKPCATSENVASVLHGK